MKNRTTKFIVMLLAAFAFAAGSSRAAIVYDNNVAANQDYTTSATVDSSYTPTAGTDSALVLVVSADNTFSAPTASFGSMSLTLAAANTRTAVFYLFNPGSTAQSLTLKLGSDGNARETISYGTLTNVDTSVMPTVATSVTRSGATLTADALSGLDASDFVLAAFVANATNGYQNSTSRTYSNPLTEFDAVAATADSPTFGYTGAIGGGIVGVSGDYSASVTFNGGDYSGTPGDPVEAAAIAFSELEATVIPTPAALPAGALLLGALVARRRRR